MKKLDAHHLKYEKQFSRFDGMRLLQTLHYSGSSSVEEGIVRNGAYKIFNLDLIFNLSFGLPNFC